MASQRAPTTPNQLHPVNVPGNFSRNLAAPGSWAGMRGASMADDGVHFRSSKVQSIAEEIQELENRFHYLAGRNKWLSSRLLREKQQTLDSFMFTNEKTRKQVFFRTWKDMMNELRLEKALSLQTDALRHCQESADSLGQVLSQEQSARRSAEAQSRRTLQELQQVQDGAAGLEKNVDAKARRIWQLTQQLEQAEGLISSGRQAAKDVLEQMAAHERKMTTLSDTRKPPSLSEDAMHNSRKVRNDFKDTLQQVSGLLVPKESSPDSKTQAVRWQTQQEEYTRSPPPFPASPSESQKLQAEGPQQERQQHQLQLQRQMQQLEQQRKERQMDRQRIEQEQSVIQQAQRETSMQEQQQQLQRMHEERMQANLQQQQMIQKVEQDRLRSQAKREAEGRASSSANRFQHGEDGAAGAGSRRAPQSLSPMGRKQGEPKMRITTGPAVMRGASGKVSSISPTGAARPASLAEPWWYGQ